MNIIEISCPAKTFVLGEYAVLDGGPALIMNTAPRFICRIQKSAGSRLPLLPENSPAGQWILKNPQDFQSTQMDWFSAYGQKGGLGFSSAQFNILYAYSFILREGAIDQISPREIWRSYRSLQFEGFMPSGADVVSQWVGGVGVFEQNPLSVETLTSALPDLHCLILRTGDHFATYKYLKDFELGDVSQLKRIAEEGIQAIKKQDEEAFVSAVNDYRRELERKHYITKKSKALLEKISRIKAVRACKACGAMGAEILVVFYSAQDEEEVRREMSFLECVADETRLTYGVAFQKLTKPEEVLL